jgi:enoyl-CoA hydratase/carnithine racemase
MVTRHEYERHIDAIEKLYLDTLMSTSDAAEGIRAFQEKRQPEWKDA